MNQRHSQPFLQAHLQSAPANAKPNNIKDFTLVIT
jgi:hypothetical protein